MVGFLFGTCLTNMLDKRSFLNIDLSSTGECEALPNGKRQWYVSINHRKEKYFACVWDQIVYSGICVLVRRVLCVLILTFLHIYLASYRQHKLILSLSFRPYNEGTIAIYWNFDFHASLTKNKLSSNIYIYVYIYFHLIIRLLGFISQSRTATI